uniref:Uncharacterized protein n=1 Tax=viral metagenome TaxID=1070528 RepID=A0A6H1ZN09_9ZZZZ
MATDEPDFTQSVRLTPWWDWKRHENFVERWERGLFDKRKFHGRTGSYYHSQGYFPPPYWTSPPLLPHINTNQPAPFDNAIDLVNSLDGVTLDEVYFGPAACFRMPMIMNFDAYFPALNLANYPNGTALYAGFEVNSGGWIGDVAFWTIHTAGGIITNELIFTGVREGIPLGGGVPVVGLVTGAWRSFKIQVTDNDITLYQQTNVGAGFPMTELARLPMTLDYIAYMIPFFANESSVIQQGVRIGQMQIYNAVRLKEVRRIINSASIVAGGEVNSGCIHFPKSAVFQIYQAYPIGAAAGVIVYILGAPNQWCGYYDTENATDAFATFTPTFVAGGTYVRSFLVENLPKYGKVVVRNADPANAQGQVYVDMHKLPYERE